MARSLANTLRRDGGEGKGLKVLFEELEVWYCFNFWDVVSVAWENVLEQEHII